MWRESRLLSRCPFVIQHIKYHARNVSLLQNDKDVDTRNANLQNARKKIPIRAKNFQFTRGWKDSSESGRCPTVGEYLHNYVIYISPGDLQICSGVCIQ